jgi:hypothetical protein
MANAEAAAAERDASVRGASERIDVDDGLRPHHVELHQIEQRRAAGEIVHATLARSRSDGAGRIRRPFIDEGLHGYSLLAVFMAGLACFTASTMLG